MNTPASNRRLQIATRIHYALLRELGHGIDVGCFLKHPLYARDVLLVCDACAGNDLPRLAKALRGMTPAATGAAGGTPATGDAAGFGASQFASSALPSLWSTPPEGWADSLPVA
jgi:hypothetical protein